MTAPTRSVAARRPWQRRNVAGGGMATTSPNADARPGTAEPPRPRRVRAILGMIKACHAEPTAAVTLVSVLLALAAGRGAGGAAEVGVTVLATQLSVGWSNDWLDA